MSCEEVRRCLLEWPLPRLVELEPHLRDCAECRELAERVRTIEEAVAMDIESFEEQGSFDQAWAVAASVGRSSRMHGVLVMLAAAAVLVVTASSLVLGSGVWWMTRPPLETSPGGIVPVVTEQLPDCGHPTALESSARSGQLAPEEVRCLQGRVDAGGPEAIGASRVLMLHWGARGDDEAWRGAAELHVAELDPDDSQLLLRLAEQIWRTESLSARDEVLSLLRRAEAGRLHEVPAGRQVIDMIEREVEVLSARDAVQDVAPSKPPTRRRVDPDASGGTIMVFARGFVGTELLMDGESVGELPARIAGVEEGRHTFTIRSPDGDITLVHEVRFQDPTQPSVVNLVP